jgi:hypothetical protein
MNGYVIAAKQEDRAKYADFLHVWGKDRTYLSDRQAKLLDAKNNQV